MIGKLVLGLWIAHFFCSYVNNAEATNELRLGDESLDERNDAEIFRAVVQSMNEWESKKNKGGHRNKREVSRVCYEDVSCFEDTGPFSYLEMLPSPPKDVGTRFFVYGNGKARSIPMEVPAENISENINNAIDSDLPTKVIVHGFGSSCDHIWIYEMRSALAAVIECNIVCVDWGPGSAVPNYVRAAANTRLVGRQLAKLVRSLNVSLDKIHLIGFSLGAHVAGFAGAELGNVSRITGLDPAGPLFESQDPRARLDKTDAHFVDVIHSNGEQLILGGLGSWQPMGDVDFYPNGGKMQSGCSNLFVGAVSDIIWSSPVEGRSLCNHRRAYKLFTDSISPKCHFPAFPCESGYEGLLKGECFPCKSQSETTCGVMGFYSDVSAARGQLYLVTRDEEPFCAHQYQVKVYNSRHERPVKSYGKLQVTLLAEGSINETFTMTKKDDEELLVGATLQKIVVPHPALSNLNAIEIKYTAYSGWISSGLVSWAVDKIIVVDSYGIIYSVCKRGLILESERPVYLPLYEGECNVPPETEEGTKASTAEKEQPPKSEEQPAKKENTEQRGEFHQEQLPAIGPFTRDQNYDRSSGKDNSFTNEVPQKSFGPYTKEQNMKIGNSEHVKNIASTDYAENSNNGNDYQSVSSSWSILDLANDGASNSVDDSTAELTERGRGFSGFSGLGQRPFNPGRGSATAVSGTSVRGDEVRLGNGEVQEPVLRIGTKKNKKETGRALRLPEITEPVLRPRSGTRRDAREQPLMEDRRHETLDESSSSRGFTVQFLPERLAGILAQAERYARQTLLPLISQYTPSFIGGGRSERPKYFPPLGNLFGTRDDDDRWNTSGKHRKRIGESNDSRTKYYFDFEEKSSASVQTVTKGSTETVNYKMEQSKRALLSTSTTSASLTDKTDKSNEWMPIPAMIAQNQHSDSRQEKSFEGGWLSEGGTSWSAKTNDNETVVTETKIDDWVPLVVVESTSSPESTDNPAINITAEQNLKEQEKKFIPLVEIAVSGDSPKADIPEAGKVEEEKLLQLRSVVFPYVYERKNDPRTRYIPLIPQEDLGISSIKKERER
ncbi:PREDICTED: uncharacterized protein LOC105360313 [Ceratosolen solmsi marchali]|uniref:phospholipase A1 n=1 Tax=Ceratosolen solmsi marchali TaxID=326594 RepID=A0AAJ6VNA9_9HYME|nr:PREDICTED: uncharacterized protein LOC105360313 [Ceratosolen solmsi marchali]